MGGLKISQDEMAERVARFDKLQVSPQAFVDTRLPGHERDIFNVIGKGVTEDSSLKPAIGDAQGFNVTYTSAEPGNGAALHAHPTVEVFIPMSGKWSVFWGDEGEEEVILGPWDVISVPVGVMRGFRNVGDSHAYLMAIIGGSDAGKVTWAESVLRQANESGLALDAQGNLVEETA